jgi:hypothetical protein
MKFLSDILARAGLVVEGVVTLNNVANATIDTDKFLTVDSGVVKFRTGAQLLSDIGGQALLTNPITGTGTAGQVAFYNGTTTITGDSDLYWDNTNKRLGVGAATPYTTFQVGSTSGAKYIGVVDTADTSYNIAYFGHNGTKLHIGFSNSNTSISERNAISIDSSTLYVGLGVSAPANRLQIGSVGATGYSGNHFAFGNGTAATAFFQSNTSTQMYVSTYLALVGNMVIGGLTSSGFNLDVIGTFRATSTVTIGSIANATTNTDRYLVSDAGVIKYRTAAQLFADSGAQTALNGTGFVRMTGTTVSYITGTSSQFVKADGSLDSSVYLTSYTETSTLANVTARGASTSTAVTFSGGASISNLLINGAAAYTEGSLALGAMGTTEGGQLVLNRATSHTFAAHLDVWQDVFRVLYGTNTATTGIALSINLSTRQLILPQYTTATTFTGTAAGVLAFDSSGNVITIAVPTGAVSSISAGTGVSVNSTTGAVTVSIGQSVATTATPTFDQVISTNNGNGTNFRIGDDAWIGDINAANTFRVQGQQDATQGYIVFGNSNATALGRSGTGALTYGGNTVYHAGNLTNLNQLTNGPGYITSSSLSSYVPYTGASTNVNLGNNTLSVGFINILGSALGAAGYLGLRQNASIIYAGSGYTSIVAEDKTFLSIQFDQDGGTNGKFARFNAAALTNNTQRTYSLPNASGTLALTSDIPTVAGVYLPLSGGTLTGALGGTSATFSSSVYAGASSRFGFGSSGAERGSIALDGGFNWSFNTNSIGNAMYIQSTTGNVVIGNTVASNVGLTIYGANAATIYQTANTGTGAGNGFYVGHTGDISYIWNYNNYPTVFATNNTERMRITSGGNVGIGTTNPLSTLHVSGSDAGFRITGSSRAQMILTNGLSQWQLESPTGVSNVPAGAFGIIESGVGSRLTILTGGDVGIGTTAPLYRLEVQNSTGDDHIAAVGTAPSIQLMSANSGPANWGTIGMATATNNFLIGAAAGDLAIINRGSTVGSILFGFGSTERIRFISTGQLRLNAYTSSSAFTGTAVATLAVDSSGNVITVTGGGGSSQWVTSGSDIYYNTGNVGIGTTSPTARLEVKAPNTGTTTNYASKNIIANSPLVGGYTGAPIVSILAMYDGSIHGADIGYLYDATGYGLAFSVNDNTLGNPIEALRINRLGNVGIGTTNPTDKLTVVGADNGITISSIAANRPVFQLINGSTTMLKLSANGIYGAIADNTGSDIVFFKGGNVGINTTSATRRLHVVSSDWDNTSGGGVIIDNSNTVGSGLTLRPTASAVTNGTNGWSIYAGGPGAAIADGNLGFWAHGTNEARLVIQRGGSVGIGTTTPSTRLHVENASTASVVLARGFDANLASSFALQHAGGGSRTEVDGTWYMSYGSAETNFGLTPNLGGGMVFWFTSGATTTNPMTLKRNGQTVFSGNVGIGTNSPTKTLHVLTSGNEGIYLQGTGGGVWMDVKSAAGKIWSYGAQNDGCGIYNRTDGVYRMFIADSGIVTLSNTVVTSDGFQGRYYRINEASANRGGLYPYNLVTGSGTDYSVGIFSEGEIFLAPGGSATKRFTMNSSGAATFSSSITCSSLTETSTIKVKENIVNVDSALDQVEKLQAVSYNRKGSAVKEIGLIAEAVEEIYPEFVQYDQHGEPVGLNYSRLTAVLIESVKELKNRIQQLENRN